MSQYARFPRRRPVVAPRRDGGQGLAEYAMILGLVAIVVVAALALFGEELQYLYCRATYQIAPDADLSSACQKPIIVPTMNDSGAGFINFEAKINDPDGDPNNPYAKISKVEFYIDSTNGSPVQVEYIYPYCIGGSNSTTCFQYNIGGLSPGKHTIYVHAYDSDGNVGKSRYGFTK